MIELMSKILRKSVILIRIGKDSNRKVSVSASGNIYDLLDSFTIILSTLLSNLGGIKTLKYTVKQEIASRLIAHTIVNLENDNIHVNLDDVGKEIEKIKKENEQNYLQT